MPGASPKGDIHATAGAARLRFFARGFVLLLHGLIVFLAARCAWLQVVEHDAFVVRQERYLHREHRAAGERGSIWTRDGEALVRNEPYWVIALDPQVAAGSDEQGPAEREARVRRAVQFAAPRVSLYDTEGALEGEAVKLLATGGRYLPMGEVTSPEHAQGFGAAERRHVAASGARRRNTAAAVTHFGPGAFAVERRWRRVYPHGDLALQLLGESRAGGVRDGAGRLLGGIHGLEEEFDAVLAGGQVTRVLETGGRVPYRRLREEVEPARGRDLIVTIDLKLQVLVENLVSEALATTHARRVIGVVIDPSTGAVRAAANAPLLERDTYSRRLTADPRELERHLLNLRALEYEPGSTIKPLIMAEAIERGVDIEQVVTTTSSYMSMSPFGVRRIIRDTEDHDHPFTIAESLIYSSNVGMVRAGLIMGEDALRSAIRRFDGRRPRQRWDTFTTTSVPMGYEVYFTPWKLITAFAAIANGGYRIEPYFVESIDGRLTDHALLERTEERRVLAHGTTERLRGLLRRAAVEGTGKHLNSGPVGLAGKTGTAKIWENGAWTDKYRSSFIGFAPWENPRFLVYVLVDRPQGVYYGAQVAGPVARKIIGALVGEEDNSLQVCLRRAIELTDGEHTDAEHTNVVHANGCTEIEAPPMIRVVHAGETEEGTEWEDTERRSE